MIIIGDVHGQYNLLMKLFDELPQTKNIVFVGDLIDRGPDSEKVVDFVKDGHYPCVMGNHESLLIKSLDTNFDPDINRYFMSIWIQNGGGITLDSFGPSINNYLDFFNNLPLMIEFDFNGENYLISHSYAIDGKNTSENDILWERYFSKPIEEDIINIFGHTIFEYPRQFHGKHWCIDTGANKNKNLTAYDLNTGCFYHMKE